MMYVNDEVLKEKQLLESEEIELLLDEYKKDKTNEELLYEINIQQRLIDNYIVSNGYFYASELGKWVLKSKIADSYMLGTDIGVIIAESIIIPSKEDANYNEKDPGLFDKYIQVGNGQVSINKDCSNLLSTIYSLQENLGNNGYSYNEDRNDLLKDSINDMEKMVSKEYKLKLK